jgi:GNAT superfamily N-acetyltransferase
VIEDPPDPAEVAWLEREVAAALLQGSEELLRVSEFTASVQLEGRVVGGIYGAAFGATCELQHLFVEPRVRRMGIGRQLMQAAEIEAARRGCSQVVLFTHASLGEDYYPQLGYHLVARVDEYPDGDAALWFRKDL